MNDLIERLRGDLIVTNELHEVEIRHEAADALESVQAKNRELAEALLEALYEQNWLDKGFNGEMFDAFTALAKKSLPLASVQGEQ